jgi:hypothetical protein
VTGFIRLLFLIPYFRLSRTRQRATKQCFESPKKICLKVIMPIEFASPYTLISVVTTYDTSVT